MEDIYEPILRKINSWILYDQNKPKVPYEDNKRIHWEYRRKNDLDCILNDNNSLADTIFSLWLPLRIVLVRINGYYKLNKLGKINNKIEFVNKFQTKDYIEQYLPIEDERVVLLSKLFVIGQKKENTMILPSSELQEKGKYCYDYMPHFLYECFPNGIFSKAFDNDIDKFSEWLIEQKLTMFFKDQIIKKENIIDLSGSGDIKNNIPPTNMEEFMLQNYIDILEQRKKEMN